MTFPFIYSTEFDFKPTNSEFLLLSRLDFLTKHRRVRNITFNFIDLELYEALELEKEL
jgi:hypothetical protein